MIAFDGIVREHADLMERDRLREANRKLSADVDQLRQTLDNYREQVSQPATIDLVAVHDVARRIARALPATIDGRVTATEDQKAIHEKYGRLRVPERSFGDAAEDARTSWVADVIVEMLAKEQSR